ncbi:Intron-binding protein aquarius [Yarrowia sp. B02]|nr:Intron-binding protein aquarius [Yarrowia sp. B02]
MALSTDLLKISPLAALLNKDNVSVHAVYQFIEKSGFNDRDLHTLESLNGLERLWPLYNQKQAHTNAIVVALLVLSKANDGFDLWTVFEEDPVNFGHFYKTVLNLVAGDKPTRIQKVRTKLLRFLTVSFQWLDSPLVRSEAGALVSVYTWMHMDETVRENLLKGNKRLGKLWRGAMKAYDKGDKKEEIDKQSAFLATLIDAMLQKEHDTEFVDAFLCFLISIVSQIPSRRFANSVIKSKNVCSLLKKGNADLLKTLDFYAHFPMDDFSGEELTPLQVRKLQTQYLEKFQLYAFENLPEKLRLASLCNFASLTKEEVKKELANLTKSEIENLLNQLGSSGKRLATLNYHLASLTSDRNLNAEFDAIDLLPTEKSLDSQYSDLTLPRLTLQYLSMNDFILKSLRLQQVEIFHQIKSDVENVVNRLKSRKRNDAGEEITGFSKYATKILNQAVLHVAPPFVGETNPGYCRVEVTVDIYRQDKREWDSLKPGDVVFLLQLGAGLEQLRGAFVYDILDSDNKSIVQWSGYSEIESSQRKFILDVDPAHWDDTVKANVLMRRKSKEAAFYPTLKTIRGLYKAQSILPDWISGVFLGYGEISEQPIGVVDLLDTFQTSKQVYEAFPDKFETTEETSGPFKLDTSGEKWSLIPYTPADKGPYFVQEEHSNKLQFTQAQGQAIVSGTLPGLTVIVGPPGTGKTDVATQIILNLYHSHPSEVTLVIAHSNQALNHLFEKIALLDVNQKHLLRLGHGEDMIREEVSKGGSFSKVGRAENLLEGRTTLLREVDRLAESIGAEGAHGDSCETAHHFFRVFVLPKYQKWQKDGGEFPFDAFFNDKKSHSDAGKWYHIDKIFTDLADIRPVEHLSGKAQSDYMLVKEAKVVAMTAKYASMHHDSLVKLGFRYSSLVAEEAAQLTEIELVIPMTLQKETGSLKRVVLIGDHKQNAPIVTNELVRKCNFDQSTFGRFIRLGMPTFLLDSQGRAKPSISEVYGWRYGGLKNLPHTEEGVYRYANSGFLHDVQFINVDDYEGQGETEVAPHVIQNLGEAEYAIALYQYMRLLGYPADKITILTMYNGQKALLQEICSRRCAASKEDREIFGMPRVITTVDQYQGEQNDYVIVSLVRTKHVGYLRDVRRMTVAVSRARLGLYVLGRYDMLAQCVELEEMMKKLAGSHDLEAVMGEMYEQKERLSGAKPKDEAASVTLTGVVHLGQYVEQMTQQYKSRHGLA